MIEITVGQAVVAFIGAMGIPSAVCGLLFWWLKRKIDAGARAQAERQAAQETLLVLMIQGEQASMALGEATAHAIQRGFANGDMEAALTYTTNVKHKIKDHLTTIGVHSLVDD